MKISKIILLPLLFLFVLFLPSIVRAACPISCVELYYEPFNGCYWGCCGYPGAGICYCGSERIGTIPDLPEESYFLPGEAIDTCSYSNGDCSQDVFPQGNHNGQSCAAKDRCYKIFQGCDTPSFSKSGVWDESESKCVTCDGNLENRILGYTQKGKCADGDLNYGVCAHCGNQEGDVGNNQCESACGADPACDEKDNGDSCGAGKICEDCQCVSEPPPDLPDLIITDISSEGTTIKYNIKNQGEASAGQTRSYLYVDGSTSPDNTDPTPSLAVGASSVGEEFEYYTWNCTGSSDTIEVCADRAGPSGAAASDGRVTESNEGNNCRIETWSCEAPPEPPDSPSSVQCQTISSSRIDVSWGSVSDATYYRVYRCQGASCTPTTYIGQTPSISYSDTGLSSNTTYRYRVRACNTIGCSSYSSSIATCTTLGSSPPPSHTLYVESEPEGAEIDFAIGSGAKDTEAAPFNITSIFEGTSVDLTATTPYTISGGWGSTTYYFYDWSGSGCVSSTDPHINFPMPDSNVTCKATYGTTPIPDSPSLSCHSDSSSQITISWNNVSNESGYRIYRCKGSGCSPVTLVKSVEADVTSWQNGGLSPGTTYGYRVKAWNSVGESPYSNTVRCTTGLPSYNLQVNSDPVEGFPITSSTGHGGTTNYPKSNISEDTRIRLTATTPYTISGGWGSTTYYFYDWSGSDCDSSTDPAIDFFMPDKNVTCLATYGTEPPHKLTVKSSPSNFYIHSTTDHDGTTKYDKAVLAGTSVKLEAKTIPGYNFSHWSGCASVGNKVNFNMPDSDKTCTAYYNPIPEKYTLRVRSYPPDDISIWASPSAYSGVTNYSRYNVNESTMIWLVAPFMPTVDDINYLFEEWTGAGCNNPYIVPWSIRFVMANNRTCTALYKELPFTLTVDSDPTNISVGSTTGHSGTTDYNKDVKAGSSVSLEALDIPGYEFDHWSGCSSSTNKVINFNMPTHNDTCIANYQLLGPDAPTGLSVELQHCLFEGNTIPKFGWDDPPPGDVADFQIRIRSNNSFPEEPDSSEFILDGYFSPPSAPLWRAWYEDEDNYYWKVKIQDSDDNWSAWSSETGNFYMPKPAPHPVISDLPGPIIQGEEVYFNAYDSTVYYDPGTESYEWSIDPLASGDFCSSNDVPEVCIIFKQKDSEIELTITDARGEPYSCTAHKDIEAKPPLPKYREVAPR